MIEIQASGTGKRVRKTLNKAGVIPGARQFNYGRQVVINDTRWDEETKTRVSRTRNGIFHVWGYRRFGGRTEPPTMMTVAIVELEDGRVTSKLPDEITFLDKESQ